MKKKLLLSLLLLFIGVSSGNANTIIASMADETYKWFEPSGSIALATNATYRNASATSANAEDSTIGVVGSHRTSVNLNPVTLFKTQEVNITTQPISTTVCVGESLVLFVTATGTNLTYQWFKGTTALVGQTGTTLSIVPSSIAFAGIYTVKITSSNQVITSDNAVVIVNESPMIVTQPVGTTVCEEEPINLSVTAIGTNLTYQWFLNGDVIPLATSATYTIASATLAD